MIAEIRKIGKTVETVEMARRVIPHPAGAGRSSEGRAILERAL
jgi:hypothetical protein